MTALVAPPTAPEAKPPVKSKTRSEYRPDIDGIRGAAAIMVMGFHAKVPGFDGAYIGLDLFFVVSGFVITGLLMYEFEKTGSIRWGAFYARRARRLIPAKATMLIGVLILSYYVLTPTGSQQETAKSAAAAAGFVSNFFFWRGADVNYFAHAPGTGVLLHTWSLSVEEQFYLALPIALLVSLLLARVLRVPAVRTLLFTALALGLASVWLAVTWAHSNPEAAYYLPITRAFEFLIGVALALVVRKVTVATDVREVMGLAGAAICAYVLWRPMPVDGYPSYWALLPCAGAMLMVWAGTGGPTAISRFLSLRLLVGLGLVSYGWYLWHWPFLVLGESLNLAPPPLWARIGLVLLALGVAYLSWRFIEGLFYTRSGAKTRGVTWGPRRIVVSGVTAMSTVIALAFGALSVADARADSPHWEAVAQQLGDVPQMPSACLADGEEIPGHAVKCDLVPFEKGRPTVVLWGDSHAWMFIPALEAAVSNSDVNLVAFVMGSCPPFDPDGVTRTACTRNNRLALDFVTKHADNKQPTRVVLSASWGTYRGAATTNLLQERGFDQGHNDYVDLMSSLFKAGAPKLFKTLGALDVDVDVVGPTAFLTRNAPLCKASARPYSCDRPRYQAIPDEASTIDWIDKQMRKLPRSARYIDVTQALCDATTCYAASDDDGVVNYFDDNHLSAEFSSRLMKYFEPTVRAVS